MPILFGVGLVADLAALLASLALPTAVPALLPRGAAVKRRTKLPNDPEAQLRAVIAATCKPGVAMLLYAHDDWCPAGDTQGAAPCICTPDVYLVEEVAPNEESAVRN